MLHLVRKLRVASLFVLLILIPVSAEEWEVFTGTLIEFGQNGVSQKKVNFKSGAKTDAPDEFFNKPQIKYTDNLGESLQAIDPEVVNLAGKLMLEGYRDFTLETSIFGGKSLVATKGKQQTRLGLSREFSVIDVSTKVDQNGDGVFDRSEKPSEEVRKQVEKGIRMVKSHHDSGRKERQKERQNSANEHGGFAYGKNLSSSNGDTETGHKTPSHSNRYGYGDSGKPERRTDGDGKKAQSDKGSIAKQRGPVSKPSVTSDPGSKPDLKIAENPK